MTKKIIRLCYRKIIDAGSKSLWDKYVFEGTYKEFQLQSQFYNQEKKYTAFSDLLLNVKGAEKLHFLVSAAISGYLQQLHDKIPDITDSTGRQVLLFKNYQFDIIQSDVKDQALHRVAINFIAEPMLWHGSIGENLLLSAADAVTNDDGLPASLIPLQPFLGIYSIKEISDDQHSTS